MTSFNCIMETLTSFKNGTLCITLLINDADFMSHFEDINIKICSVEECFKELLKNIESDVCKNNMQKIAKLIKGINQYKDSNIFVNKLKSRINKDKNINIEEQYNKIINYLDKYNSEHKQEKKIDYSELTKDGKINEELVREISNRNIDYANNIILDMLMEMYNFINNEIYINHCKKNCYKEPNLDKILYGRIFSKYYSFWDKYKYYNNGEFGEDNKLIFNPNLCYDFYYTKYANILWEDISKMIN